MTIGGQFEIPLKCATVLPPTLVEETLQHAPKGVASSMFSSENDRVSYFEVTGELLEGHGAADLDDLAGGGVENAPRPRCLQAGTTGTFSAGKSLSALLRLEFSANFDTISRALRSADALAIRCVAAMFDIACPGADVDRALRREFLDRVGEAVLEVFDACAALPVPAPLRSRGPAPAESLRDETLNEDIRRETHMLLATSHAHYRLLIKALRSQGAFPAEFVSLDVLPITAVRHVFLHLSAQKSIQKMVQDSVLRGISPPQQSALQQDLISRLKQPDTFLAARVLKHDALGFTQFEKLFGILSTGNLTEYAATIDYVPGSAPDTEALLSAAKNLNFGTKGGTVDYNRSFSALLACLAAVDVMDLFFDVKIVYNHVVDAMEMFGKRNEVVWDSLLVNEMRRRARHRASSTIPRETLNEVLDSLATLQAEQNEFDRLTSAVASMNYSPGQQVHVVMSDAPDGTDVDGLDDDFRRDYELAAFRVVSDRPERKCPKGLHEVPPSFDFCGLCNECFPDVWICNWCFTPTQGCTRVKACVAGATCSARATSTTRRPRRAWRTRRGPRRCSFGRSPTLATS